MATEVAAGGDPGEVAVKYGVSLGCVRQACDEFRTKLKIKSFPRHPIRRESGSFSILKRLLDGDAVLDIAKDLSVSKQYIYQIKKEAIAGGFTVLRKT